MKDLCERKKYTNSEKVQSKMDSNSMLRVLQEEHERQTQCTHLLQIVNIEKRRKIPLGHGQHRKRIGERSDNVRYFLDEPSTTALLLRLQGSRYSLFGSSLLFRLCLFERADGGRR